MRRSEDWGLSPRVRGNPIISLSASDTREREVYPRVYGGTTV